MRVVEVSGLQCFRTCSYNIFVLCFWLFWYFWRFGFEDAEDLCQLSYLLILPWALNRPKHHAACYCNLLWPWLYITATYYSYDIHGNVDTLLQDYGSSTDVPNAMNSSTGGNRFKKMVYNYDLISGKVNLVAYQPGQKDQFYHQYKYDAENRLTTVLTSKDSLFWEQEARYYYYRHGPLERMVLGQNQVQGLDYAYTLQGWLKTVNSNSVGDGIHDMGQDGFYNADDPYLGTRINSNVARDVYGYMLNYFDGDYEPINIPGINVNVFAVMPTGGLPSSLTGASLYNGNISSMLVNIPALSSNTPYLYGYRYDQLNRIKMMDAFTVTENYNNNYDQSLDIALAQTSDYKERISYDPNGKIVTYGRWGKARQLDSATVNKQ